MVVLERYQALGQMGAKNAKKAMEKANENKDGISESTYNSNTFTFMPGSNDMTISIHHSNFVSSRFLTSSIAFLAFLAPICPSA
jgi:hypothetical protein